MSVPPANEKIRDKESAALGVGAIEKMTGQTSGPAPENQRVAALVVGVAGVVALVIGLALIPGGYAVWSVVAVGLAFLLMAIALVVALFAGSKPKEPGTGDSPDLGGQLKWSRVVVKNSSLGANINSLSDALRSLRDRAKQEYRLILDKRSPKPNAIDEENIRVNVFLPDVDAGQSNAQVCELYIPDQLCHGMTDLDERAMRFWPGQGLTGLVFVSGYACGAMWEHDLLTAAQRTSSFLFSNTIEWMNQ